jgi:CO/xanthine dehydrogenase FAD-binding subunit
VTGHMQVARARDLDEISALTNRFDGRIGFIAGGTDLIIAQKTAPWPDLIIDVSQTAGLSFIRVSDEAIQIGCATTMTSLAGHGAIQQVLPVLAQAAAQIGSVQIRNRATIGGNVASAVPAGDLLPVLKCLKARIDILHRDGCRETQAFNDVVVGRGETSLANGDLITGITLPLPYGENRISAFAKIGLREVLTIARLNMAIMADFDQVTNRVNDIRIVAGAIASVPLRLQQVETVFRGRQVDQQLADDFANTLAIAVDDAIPGRHSQAYKRQAITGLGLDLMYGLFGREFDVPILQAERA